MFAKNLDKLRAGLHFSASALRTYLMCSKKFEFHYVIGAQPEFRPAELVLGTAVHQALAVHHVSLKDGMPMPAEETVSRFDAAFDDQLPGKIPLRFKRGHDVDALRTVGRGLVEVYIREADVKRIVAVEQPFRATLVDPTTGEELEPVLLGVFDLVEADEKGTVSVVELKTAARRWSVGQVDLDLQGSLYAEAVAQAGLVGEGQEALIEYRILVKNKTPVMDRQYAVRRPGDRRMAMTIAADALRAIEREAFVRNPGWQCSGCPFQRSCGIV
jgi:hypothetical protein